jgi:hypothetical protein
MVLQKYSCAGASQGIFTGPLLPADWIMIRPAFVKARQRDHGHGKKVLAALNLSADLLYL